MKGPLLIAALAVWLLAGPDTAFGVDRFPPPDFETGHELPTTSTPPPQASTAEYVDVAVLVVALLVASLLALRKRSRNAILALSVFSLIYFGFYRQGCVCAIGSIQNVALALFDSGYAIPFAVVTFFVVPLVFTLFFGRVFCSSVCPHGALQDVVLVKPVKVPAWLEQGLRIIPFVYLGTAALFAATGSAFIICEYDPFIALFRLSGSMNMLLFGGSFLALGVFVGRPYCRFLCPYGALLSVLSRFSKWHLSITPENCIQCRLCEESCPFGSIHCPTEPSDRKFRTEGRRRLAQLLILLPLLAAGTGWLGARVGVALADLHPTVELANTLFLQRQAGDAEEPEEVKAFRVTGRPEEEVFEAALAIKPGYATGGGVLGAFVGLVIGLQLLGLSLKRTRTDYETDRANCVSCARCIEYCPYEHIRRGTYSDFVPVEALEEQAKALRERSS